MSHLIWTDGAISDLQRVYHFLATKDRQLAAAATKRIRVDLLRMAQHPMLGRPVASTQESCREWIVVFGSSGYVVQYEIDQDSIVILRIKHQRERPF